MNRTAETLDWLREFEAHIDRPDVKNEKSICWDWLPADMEKDRQGRCCICGGELRKGGNDPYPVATFGRCCEACNYCVVLPKRIELTKQNNNGQGTGKN